MRSRSFIAVSAVAFLSSTALLLLAAAPAKPQPTPWEYKVVRQYPSDVMENNGHPSINDLGADGWELVSVEGHANNDGETFLFFKRPKQ